MRNDDTGKVILVTGASSGIRALSVPAPALTGHTLYAGIRQTATRNATAEAGPERHGTDHQVDIQAPELDVTSQDSADAAVDRILTERGRPDVVVHNAGHMVLGAAEAFTTEQPADLYDVNVLGTQRVNRAALPKLREQGSGLPAWNGSSSTRGGNPRSWPRTSPPRPRWTPWPSATPPRCLRSASTPRSWCPARSPPAPATSPAQAPPPTPTVRKSTTSVTDP
ncbi:SDR family NAD(P)-dependent oxidoreductase [Streptomyces antibioticus]|uniref:SDR family NAD(P)-dependent oxidoreductase n=1 Tax=Streptomyces antibioticus TaxID=1890 RepID=UPI00367959D0